MARRRRRGHSFKFTEKTHSLRGMIAASLALISLVICAGLIRTSFYSRGNADIYIGSAGIFGFFVSTAALFTAISSIKEQDTFRAIPYTAMVLSLLSVVVWVALYIGGIV